MLKNLSSIFIKEKELGKRPEQEIKFPSQDLSHSFLIKQSVRISLGKYAFVQSLYCDRIKACFV